MKDKNLPDDNNSQSITELTEDVNKIADRLETETELEGLMDEYQKLIKLNNIIEKKFQKKSKRINEITKEKINNIIKRKNEEKIK